MAKDDEPTLTAAAAALQAELDRFEALAASLRKMPLASKKNIERAARTLQEAIGYEERLTGCLRGLMEAITAASRRQQESAASIVERGREIEARDAEYREVLGAYAALGGEAQELTVLAQEIAAKPLEQGDDRLDELLGRMTHLGERVQEIARTAAAKEMDDVERVADTMKQQIAAARNRILLLRRRGRADGGQSN
jgi:chromosome segregation ATPase